jgi:hypothetical protein
MLLYLIGCKVGKRFRILGGGITQIKNVLIKSDSVSHHVSRIIKLFLSTRNIPHERINYATLNRNNTLSHSIQSLKRKCREVRILLIQGYRGENN